jgi:hypothetical protein
VYANGYHFYSFDPKSILNLFLHISICVFLETFDSFLSFSKEEGSEKYSFNIYSHLSVLNLVFSFGAVPCIHNVCLVLRHQLENVSEVVSCRVPGTC